VPTVTGYEVIPLKGWADRGTLIVIRVEPRGESFTAHTTDAGQFCANVMLAEGVQNTITLYAQDAEARRSGDTTWSVFRDPTLAPQAVHNTQPSPRIPAFDPNEPRNVLLGTSPMPGAVPIDANDNPLDVGEWRKATDGIDTTFVRMTTSRMVTTELWFRLPEPVKVERIRFLFPHSEAMGGKEYPTEIRISLEETLPNGGTRATTLVDENEAKGGSVEWKDAFRTYNKLTTGVRVRLGDQPGLDPMSSQFRIAEFEVWATGGTPPQGAGPTAPPPPAAAPTCESGG